MQMFTVYDVKAEAYLQPFFCPTEGVAMRNFMAAVNEEGHQFNLYAEDYTLFHLGEWDEKTGKVTMLSAPATLGNALSFLEAKGE